jgi:hypothetical protein
MITALGNKAHNHAAALATPRPKIRLPAKKIGTHVAEEKTILRKSAA